ncbi:MAG: hypothetical protein N5P05_002540 [Chroococcopsis gigantea SAG 12.99]|jgi:uncharacterized caspase-like protein|nr:hypothetical protein [Chroococcopsis gigantea SAG 12.99]
MLKGTPRHNRPKNRETLWHLLIGINSTPPGQRKFPSLKYAADDCQRIAAVIGELKPISPGENYHPMVLHDGEQPSNAQNTIRPGHPTKDNIEKSLNHIIDRAQANDRILVYITGHGIPDVQDNLYLGSIPFMQ